MLCKRSKGALPTCPWRSGRGKGRKTPVINELAEAAGILGDCLLLIAWVVFSLEQGTEDDWGQRVGASKVSQGISCPIPKSPKALSSSPKNRAQNPLRLSWEVRGGLCDNS